MLNFFTKIIDNVFPQTKTWIILVIREQRRRPVYWLVFFNGLLIYLIATKIIDVLPFVLIYSQALIYTTFCLWIIALVALPFLWPPGGYFSDDFRKGLAPDVWEQGDGVWTVELDGYGKAFLKGSGSSSTIGSTIDQSDRGILVTKCLSWTDYELLFDTRIVARCAAWFVRATDLNNYAMFQLGETQIRPHRRVTGTWPTHLIEDVPLEHPIKIGKWYSVRTEVRGHWVRVSIIVDNIERELYYEQILGTQPPFGLSLQVTGGQPITTLAAPSYRVGSFGFRLSGDDTGQEKADFRNVRAFKLR